LNKRILVIMLATVLLLLIGVSQSFAEEPIKTFIDGQKINFTNNPIIENGTTLVEFRPIFEKLGLQIGWNEATQTVSGIKDGLDIQLQIGSNTATVNGQNKQLSIAPRIINGKTMIPLRFIGEASGKRVDWDAASKSINIKSAIENKKYFESIAVAKVNNDIYHVGDSMVFIDNNNDYYAPIATLLSLISIYYNDYVILSEGDNPFIKGDIRTKNERKYLFLENKYLNIRDHYLEGYFSNDKGKKYLFSMKPGEEKGIIQYGGRSIAPLKDVFDTLGIKYTVTHDDKNKMFIFSF